MSVAPLECQVRSESPARQRSAMEEKLRQGSFGGLHHGSHGSDGRGGAVFDRLQVSDDVLHKRGQRLHLRHSKTRRLAWSGVALRT